MKSYRDGAPQAACPRYVARRQLRRLDDRGLRLYSAFEAELTVLQRSDHKPIFGGPIHSEVCTSQLLAEFECFLYDTEKLLFEGGVDISKLHTEYGPGQLEFVPQPKFGIESADTMFRLREGIKEISLQKGWLATFMAQVRDTDLIAICLSGARRNPVNAVCVLLSLRWLGGLTLTATLRRLLSRYV